MRACWVVALGMGMGCAPPLDLPLVDEVPIVPKPFEPCRPEEDSMVACTVDGDTFDLRACGDDVGERVRMLGIDAPETSEPAECYADVAALFVDEMLAGQDVVLTFDRDCEGVFGRTLAYVWLVDSAFDRVVDRYDLEDYVTQLGEGGGGDLETTTADQGSDALLLNEVLLGEGFADQFPEEFAGTLLHQQRFDRATAQAQARGKGLWGACIGG